MYTVTVRQLQHINEGKLQAIDKVVCQIGSVDSATLGELSNAFYITDGIKFVKHYDYLDGHYEIVTDNKDIRILIEYVPTIDEMVGNYEYYCAFG